MPGQLSRLFLQPTSKASIYMYTLTYQQKYIFKTSTVTCIIFMITKQIFTNVLDIKGLCEHTEI